jgi:hypothetical protein
MIYSECLPQVEVRFVTFNPKNMPQNLHPLEAPLKHLAVLKRFMTEPYPLIERMSLVKLLLDRELDAFQTAMGLVLLARLGINW